MADVLLARLRAPGLRLRPQGQLFRLAGVRPPLCHRRARRRCRPICSARTSRRLRKRAGRRDRRARLVHRASGRQRPPPSHRRLRAARCAGLDDRRAARRAVERDRAHGAGPARASSSAPPARRRSCRAACRTRSSSASATTAEALPRADREGPLVDLRRLPPLYARCLSEASARGQSRRVGRVSTWTRSTATSGTSTMRRASSICWAATA